MGMHLCVCIDALFPEKDFMSGLQLAAGCGYRWYEFWSWQGRDLPLIRREADRLGMRHAGCCVPFIPLTEPGRREEFLRGLRQSLGALQALGGSLLIAQVGPDTGEPREEQHRSIVEGLRAAAPMLEEAGAMLVIEPLNLRVDHAGYYLSESEEAFSLIEETGSPAIKVLFDIYHQQITEGDLIRRISAHIGQIGHFHAAGNPGRHELDIGEIYYPAILKAAAEAGYSGRVGLEYRPQADVRAGLARMAESFSAYL